MTIKIRVTIRNLEQRFNIQTSWPRAGCEGFSRKRAWHFFIRLPASWAHRPDTSTDAATTRRPLEWLRRSPWDSHGRVFGGNPLPPTGNPSKPGWYSATNRYREGFERAIPVSGQVRKSDITSRRRGERGAVMREHVDLPVTLVLPDLCVIFLVASFVASFVDPIFTARDRHFSAELTPTPTGLN